MSLSLNPSLGDPMPDNAEMLQGRRLMAGRIPNTGMIKSYKLEVDNASFWWLTVNKTFLIGRFDSEDEGLGALKALILKYGGNVEP